MQTLLSTYDHDMIRYRVPVGDYIKFSCNYFCLIRLQFSIPFKFFSIFISNSFFNRSNSSDYNFALRKALRIIAALSR